MASNYPAGTDILVQPQSTDFTNVVGHASNHQNANSAIMAIESTVGTHSGTNILKNFVAGNFPVRQNASNVFQNTMQGTLTASSVSGTVNTTAGTVQGATLGTNAIIGGTSTNQIINTPTVNTAAINTSSFNGGTSGTLTNIGGVSLKDNGAITQTGTADHVTLTPGASKVVKLTVIRQNLASTSYMNSSFIQEGWDFVTGDGSNSGYTKTISFPVTFVGTPLVFTTPAGALQGSDPTQIGDLTAGWGAAAISGRSVTAGSFVADLSFAVNLTNAKRVAFTWIAIGTI